MNYLIEIQNELNRAVDEALLVNAAKMVLSQHGAQTESSITVVITDNEQVAALNKQFRDIDAPTDVLSFPADALPVELDDEPPYLGDLIIAYPYASAQAEHEGHGLNDSFALLVVHGTLHLLGYDHDTPDHRAAMWAAQEKALRALNISPHIVPAMESRPDDH